MIKIPKKLILIFVFFVIMSASFIIKTEAFSLDFFPVTLIQKTFHTITSRTLDIVYYLVMQKKYIFDNYSDPNVYPDLSIPENIKDVLPITDVSSFKPTNKPITPTDLSLPDTEKVNEKKVVIPSVKIFNPPPILHIKIDPVINPDSEEDQDNTNNFQILNHTNIERMAVSLESLKINSVLNKIADLRARDLFANQYFEHISPSGDSASSLAKNFSFDYILIGENLALGNFKNGQEIVEAWMNSPGHKENILNEKYTELGISVKNGLFKGESMTVAVQIFARPLKDCIKPNPQNKELIDDLSLSLAQMQAEAKSVYDNIIFLKNNQAVDKSFYNQKIQEYNYFVKNINDVVLVIKNLIDLYNLEIRKYNACINI